MWGWSLTPRGRDCLADSGDIAKAIQPFARVFEQLTGPMAEELGLLLRDKVRALRQRNTSAVVEGAGRLLEDAGRPINAVPPRLLLPIIESASLENNPTIQEMWSGLLASASERADEMSPSYVEVLKQLTPVEARCLKVLYDHFLSFPFQTLWDQEQVNYVMTFGLQMAVGESIAPTLVTDTFERLGLIRRSYDLQPGSEDTTNNSVFKSFSNLAGGLTYMNYLPNYLDPPKGDPLPKLTYHLAFTSHGLQFMRACIGPCVLKIDGSNP